MGDVQCKIEICWTRIFGDGVWYVEEIILNANHRMKWGPLPSDTIADALIQERQAWVVETIHANTERPSSKTRETQ